MDAALSIDTRAVRKGVNGHHGRFVLGMLDRIDAILFNAPRVVLFRWLS